MDDWGLVRSIILTVLALTTTIATAGVGLMFGSLRTLRDTANDLRARVGDLEQERANDKEEKAALASALAEQTSENHLLKTMVMGKVEWVALTDQVGDLHKQTLVWWRKADETMAAILTEVREK